MTVIEVKENGAIRTKMLSCDSPVRVFYSALLRAGGCAWLRLALAALCCWPRVAAAVLSRARPARFRRAKQKTPAEAGASCKW